MSVNSFEESYKNAEYSLQNKTQIWGNP